MNKILSKNILEWANYTLTISQLLLSISMLLGFYIFSKLLKEFVFRISKFDEGQKYTTYKLLYYFSFIIVLSFIFKILGIDFTLLLASSTALFVGIGLGMQHLFYDFISGVILLLDSNIKVGSVIQVNETRVEVMAIRFRTSIVKTREDKEIIIPNSYFTKNQVINWSNKKQINRHYIELKVFEKDVAKAMELLVPIVASHPKVLSSQEPYVRIEKFGDYAIELKVLFWSDEVKAVGRMLGEIRLLIFNKLNEAEIYFPTPHQIITLNKSNI